MKPKLVYIDHSFHQKTKSSDFLKNILRENFEIVDLWDESWKGEKPLTAEYINSQNFEFVLFFQSLLSIKELKKIKAKIIWVPMYDGVVSLGKYFWMELSTVKIKILSFSKTISEITKKNKIETMTAQYFFDPNYFRKVADYSQKKVFFWQRTKFCFDDVKRIIGNQEIDQFILKLDPDPGYEAVFPSKEDIEKYKIRIVQGTLSKEEYLSLLAESNIFISPRKYEGIGMSFIEAMTMGMATMAYDKPTMNEYINNQNGYLIGEKDQEIRLESFKDKGINARRFCKQGYVKWLEDRKLIGAFIFSKYKNPLKINLATVLFLKTGRFINKVILYFKNLF